MKIRLLLTAAVLAAGSARATDVGVSVSVGDSGFYGRIDVGTMPRPPPVVYAQPVLVQPAPVAVERPPIYLRVPPGHAKKWRKHCHKYNACGERVFFVQERWYNEHYAAGRDAQRGDDDHPGRGHGNGNGNGKGHGKGS
ncbi:MAG TPA: hypothetical protein VFD38_06740 [Myxococcaceae bacterium]|nr:hypothetical protein [Myxococcaceae bacterium]